MRNCRTIIAAMCIGIGLAFQAAQATVFSPSDVVAYWGFEDSGYSTAADSAGSNDATVMDVGAAGSFGPGGISGQAWITDDSATAPFGGESDYLQVVGSSDVKRIGDADFSLTGWFKISDLTIDTSGTENTHFFMTDDAGNLDGYRIDMLAGHHGQSAQTTFVAGSGSVTINPMGGAWEIDKWYFIAAVANGSGSVFWLAREGDTWANRVGAGLTTSAPTEGVDLHLGRAGGAGAFDGLRDDFAVFSRAITGSEAEQIFNAGLAGNGLDTLIIPEPGSLLLAGLGGVLLGIVRRYRRAH